MRVDVIVHPGKVGHSAAAQERLGALAEALPGMEQALADAVDLIGRMEGRLIVTGLGKSGHIARKIAATFASTGTPAHFVHPAEASHGDLGMITPDDCCDRRDRPMTDTKKTTGMLTRRTALAGAGALAATTAMPPRAAMTAEAK